MNSNRTILSLALTFSALVGSLCASTEVNTLRPSALPNQCGALALYQVGRQLQPSSAELVKLLEVQPPRPGFSLADLARLSSEHGLALVAVQLRRDGDLPTPSVAHLKANHYVALLDRKRDRYMVFDPLTGRTHWMHLESLKQCASGYLLASPDPALLSLVDQTVAEQTYGAQVGYWYGSTDENDEDCPKDEFQNEQKCPTSDDEECRPGTGPTDDAGCDPCGTGTDHSGFAMPVWKVSEPYINLWIIDKPMFYTTSHDDLMVLKLTYKQRNIDHATNFWGFGKGWECNWRSYLEPVAGYTNRRTQYVMGGGIRQQQFSSSPEYGSGTKSSGGGSTANVASKHGGGWNFQDYITGQFGILQFPTERIDIKGRTNRFVWATNNSVFQLVQYVDGDGKTNYVRYQNTNFYHLVTEVENPYGRKATLKYDTNGFLTNIVDMIGMSNTFAYDAQGLITNMSTPYGTTVFQAITNANGVYAFGGDNLVNRALLITEPNGGKQLYTYRHYANKLNPTNETPLIPDSYSTPSTEALTNTFETRFMYERNSFYWGRQQYATLPEAFRTNAFTTNAFNTLSTNDYNLARMKHWLYTPSVKVGQTLGMIRYPSPDGITEGQMVWYDYAGKQDGAWGIIEGTNSRPSLIARVLPDTTSQFVYFERNSWWNRTKVITTYSTVGTNVFLRTNTIVYAANDIDRISVKDQDNNLLLGFGNYVDRLPRLITNAVNEVTTLTINATNRQISSIRWPSGLTTTNLYFTSGTHTNWLQETKDLETTNSYTFTYEKGLVKDFTDSRGLTVTLSWDALERLTNAAFPNGTIKMEYNRLDLSRFTDRLTNSYNFYYNPIRQLASSVDPLNRGTTYTYCDCGSLESITDALSRTTSFSYDKTGRRTNVVYPGGYSITNFYSQIGRLTNVTDNAGNNVTNWFSNNGLLIASSNAFGQVFKGIYDHKNRSTNSVTSDGVAIDQTFDNLNRMVTRKWPDNGIEKFFYTARGLTNYTDQLTNITHFYYNEANRLTKRINLTSAGTPVETNRFEYHQSGDLLRLYDGKNQLTSWAYDQYGRVTNKVDAAGTNDFVYQYDANDRLTTRTTPAKGDTTYKYDAVGNLTNIVYAASVNITNSYDALNRLTNMVDAAGTTRFAYNVNGLLDNEDGPWTDDTITYGYNSGRLRTSLSVQAPNASSWVQSYLYDNVRRLTNVASPAGSFGYEFAPGVGSATTASSLIKKLSLPGGTYITNNFDSVARLLGTKLKNSSHTLLNSHDYLYDVGGERTSQTFKEGNYLDYTYDTLGQLKTALGKESGGGTSRIQEQFKYGYDYARNLNYRTNNALVQTFGVNNLNQLTNATRSGTLTVAGTTTTNATNVTVNSQTATRYADATFAKDGFTLADGNNTFTALAQDNRGRSDTHAITFNLPATVTYSYDANGNLTNDVRRKFTYDDENQLSSIIVTNAANNSTLTTNVYDGLFRRRVRREFSWVNGKWEQTGEFRYIYDGGVAVQERDGNNLLLISYTRGTDLSGRREGAGGIGGLLARTDHGQLAIGSAQAHAFYHADGGGNVTALVNDKQAIVGKYLYGPFGNTLSKSGPLSDANTYRFSSKEVHPDSGLYYYGFRFYDPNVQRWLNRDPLGERFDRNLYRYVYNAPPNWVDPDGEFAVTIGPITIFVPFTTPVYEQEAEVAHETQHRDDWLTGIPGWKKEQRGFAAECPVLKKNIKDVQKALDDMKARNSSPKNIEYWENALWDLNASLSVAETIAESDAAAKDYWNNVSRRWWQKKVR